MTWISGSHSRAGDQGVLGSPLVHTDFVDAHLERTTREHSVLIERIPSVPDLQSAWLLRVHCAAAKATHLLRVLPPITVRRFAEDHDEGLRSCLCQLLGVLPNQRDMVRASATVFLVLGGLGLRSAVRHSEPPLLASCADCFPMMQDKHPEVARGLVAILDAGVYSLFGRCRHSCPESCWHARF